MSPIFRWILILLLDVLVPAYSAKILHKPQTLILIVVAILTAFLSYQLQNPESGSGKKAVIAIVEAVVLFALSFIAYGLIFSILPNPAGS